MPYKTMSIRIDKDDYDFVKTRAKEEKENLSSAVKELIDKGRVHLAMEEYKRGGASLGRASRLAGVSVSEMMDILAEYGVAANLEEEDYLKSLETIGKLW